MTTAAGRSTIGPPTTPRGSPVTPFQFQRARHKLKLTQKQLAHVLGLSEVSVRRYEMGDDCSNHRDIPEATAELMRCFLAGHRSARWPKQEAA